MYILMTLTLMQGHNNLAEGKKSMLNYLNNYASNKHVHSNYVSHELDINKMYMD